MVTPEPRIVPQLRGCFPLFYLSKLKSRSGLRDWASRANPHPKESSWDQVVLWLPGWQLITSSRQLSVGSWAELEGSSLPAGTVGLTSATWTARSISILLHEATVRMTRFLSACRITASSSVPSFIRQVDDDSLGPWHLAREKQHPDLLSSPDPRQPVSSRLFVNLCIMPVV